MANTSGTQLSEGKEAEITRNCAAEQPREDFHKSTRVEIIPELPETLGLYNLTVVSQEDREQPAEPLLTRFIAAELTRGYFLGHNEAIFTERREKIYTCMRIPKELEKLMIFGCFLCLDAFLYIFTLLPLRAFLAVLRLLTLPCSGFRVHTCPYCRRSSGSQLLQPAQVCDMLKGLIMVLCFSMMHYVDYSMMYHLIRGQSVIKLYLIFNMLEMGDRLFSSLGQDILDSLYWTATEPKERKRDRIKVIPHFLMAVSYVYLHAILVMVKATALNVAFNSHNTCLLTIMLTTNFVEIKANAFKRVGKKNLFQMANSDIKERFTSYILLLIVCLRNFEQFEWKQDYMWKLFPNVFIIIIAEVGVDNIKHAFITKFNDMSADVYTEFRASLAFDLVSTRQKNACTDYSDSVARSMGYIPLPSAIMVIRVLVTTVKVQGALSYTCVFLFYLGLLTLKVLNSIILLGKSYVYVKRANMEDKLFETPSSAPSSEMNVSKADQNASPTSPDVSKVEEITATHCSPPPSSSSSATTQPTPTTDPFPAVPTDASPAPPASRPPSPPPEPEHHSTPLSREEEGEAEGASELRHRAPNKDLLEIDRYTICGRDIC